MTKVTSKLTVTEKILGVLTALLTLATGFLTYKTAVIAQAKEQVQSQYDATQSENARLRTQLGIGGPTANPQAPPGATVRHSGQIVVSSSGDDIDLDSSQSNYQWSGLEGDMYYDGNAIKLRPNIQELTLQDVKADYNSCSERMGYGDGGSDLERRSLQPGTYFCIKTNEKRYSALRLIQITPTTATLDVVTYDPPVS